MPRNHNPGTSSLRNRNRITNKTRLKILRGPVDADPLILDEETFVSNSVQTAGVDAEETNEHHLQAVLSAASKRNQQSSQRSNRADKVAETVAYIPVPDSTGLADNYEELYPAGRWKDPATYIATSATVEECCIGALANGFTYYMDERDKEWLDKNNEEARGEGTSTQGAVSASASGATRVSARSAKAKGKEPEFSQPIVITEDLFELVMGLFEKVTHEKTEHLHLSLNTGMAFPGFSEYQETFASPLHPSYFATFAVPTGIPPPTTLLRIARLVYPYWKERRLDRGGLRIIPTLNGDETDTLNESYVCFRRREIKAVRKTRASQVTSSDKLARLQTELSYPLEMAKALFSREILKKESLHNAQAVWEKRMALVDLKRKFSALGDKADDELLYDKERIVKKPKTEQPRLKLRHNEPSSLAILPEIAIRPSQRTSNIQTQIERELSKQKDRDHHWEDSIDNTYQQLPAPFASRAFKFISLSDMASSSDSSSVTIGDERQPRALRHRYGRGGRTWIDRCHHGPSPRVSHDASANLVNPKPQRRRLSNPVVNGGEKDGSGEDDEEARRLVSRWRFDEDDCPPTGSNGADENDRILVDDYNPRYMRETMKLFSDADLAALMTDNTIIVTNADGRQQPVVPYRLGPNPYHQVRREPSRYPPGVIHPQLLQHSVNANPTSIGSVTSVNGVSGGSVPVALSTQLHMKKVLPGISTPSPSVNHTQGSMRISPMANGSSGIRAVSSDSSMRPPLSTGSSPVVSSMPTNVPPSQSSPPHTHPVTQQLLPTAVNGVNRGAINMPHLDVNKSDTHLGQASTNALMNVQTLQALQIPQGQSQVQNVSSAEVSPPTADTNSTSSQLNSAVAPMRPKSQNQHAPPNGYHLGYANGNLSNNAMFSGQAQQGSGLSHQQLQTLKSAFANIPVTQDLTSVSQSVNGVGGRASVGVPYVQTPNGSTFNMQLSGNVAMNTKLAAARHMPWAAGQSMHQQRPPSMSVSGIGMDIHPLSNGSLNGGSMSPSPGLSNAVPVRSPSRSSTAIGMRASTGAVGIGHASPNRGSHSMSPHLQHSSPPLSHSPPGPAQTPLPTIPSPSILQQTVNGVQGGF